MIGRADSRVLDSVMDRLMPMHLRVDAEGQIRSAGQTLRRMIGDARCLAEGFDILRPGADACVAQLATADRLMMRPRVAGAYILRGRGAPLPGGGALIILGFGSRLVDAVRRHNLTAQDFMPADLAFEMLFLHEATGLMTAELARTNQRLAEARSAAETAAFTDPLTGLTNRRGFMAALHLALAGGKGRETKLALVAIDLDFFKDVNDRLGHAAGDEVLACVAARLRDATRAGDTVARIGGDEFVLILPGLVAVDDLLRLGQRIISALERPIQIGTDSCTVSASVGIAVASSPTAPEADALLRRGDAALYRAKQAGRRQVVLSDEDGRDVTGDGRRVTGDGRRVTGHGPDISPA